MTPDRIVLTASTSDAYSLLFKLLARRRRRSARAAAELSAVRAPDAARRASRRGPTTSSTTARWSIDFASVERALHAADARASCVVSPNNPTGSFVTRDELDRLAALCAPRGIAIIADEVFADYELDAGRRRAAPAASLTRDDVLVVRARRAVEVGRAAAGEARMDGGRRAGPRWSPPRSRGSSSSATPILSVSTPVQAGRRRAAGARRGRPRADRGARRGELPRAAGALSAAAPSCRVLRARRRLVRASCRCRRSSRRRISSLRLLTDDGVLAHPGYFFDFPRESFLIVSLLPPEPAFADGIVARPAALRLHARAGHERARLAAAARACSSRCSRVRRPRAGASATSATSRRSTAWLAGAGQRVLQLLPLNEMAPGQQSPYSAISAMAIDPIFITRADGPRVRRARRRGRARAPAIASALARGARARRASSTRRSGALKQRGAARGVRALSRAPSGAATRTRARALQAFRQRAGLVARGLRAVSRAPRARGRAAVDRVARARCSAASRRRSIARAASWRDEVLFHQYLQWLAGTQWQQARAAARTASRCSAICRSWSTATAPTSGRGSISSASTCRSARRPTRSARPDRTGACRSTTGTRSPREDFRWLRERARRSADLFDGYRIDHLVGFYRTYGRPRDGGEPFFTPADEPTQHRARRARARHLPRRRRRDHRRGSRHRARLRARVARAARRSRLPRASAGSGTGTPKGSRSAIPPTIPPSSVATSGTHDTEPLAVWWEQRAGGRAAAGQRAAVRPAAHRRRDLARRAVRCRPSATSLLEALFASGSDLLLLPMQDVFGWRDRINEPATVTRRATGPSGCRGRSIDSTRCPKRASEKTSCAPGRGTRYECHGREWNDYRYGVRHG